MEELEDGNVWYACGDANVCGLMSTTWAMSEEENLCICVGSSLGGFFFGAGVGGFGISPPRVHDFTIYFSYLEGNPRTSDEQGKLFTRPRSPDSLIDVGRISHGRFDYYYMSDYDFADGLRKRSSSCSGIAFLSLVGYRSLLLSSFYVGLPNA